MSEFNKGDHVRYTGASGGYVDRGKLGWTGYVVDVGTGYSYINWDDSQNEVSNANLSLVKGLPADPFDNDLEEPEAVSHPQHYGGDTTYEAIKVIEAWGLGFHDGNAAKYLARAGKKDKSKEIEDIDKAIWYLQRHKANLEEASA